MFESCDGAEQAQEAIVSDTNHICWDCSRSCIYCDRSWHLFPALLVYSICRIRTLLKPPKKDPKRRGAKKNEQDGDGDGDDEGGEPESPPPPIVGQRAKAKAKAANKTSKKKWYLSFTPSNICMFRCMFSRVCLFVVQNLIKRCLLSLGWRWHLPVKTARRLQSILGFDLKDQGLFWYHSMAPCVYLRGNEDKNRAVLNFCVKHRSIRPQTVLGIQASRSLIDLAHAGRSKRPAKTVGPAARALANAAAHGVWVDQTYMFQNFIVTQTKIL